MSRITEFFDKRVEARQRRLQQKATPDTLSVIAAFEAARQRHAEADAVLRYTRQLGIVLLRQAGYSNQEIAELLGINLSDVWAASTLMPNLAPGRHATPEGWVRAWNECWAHEPGEQVDAPLVQFPKE